MLDFVVIVWCWLFGKMCVYLVECCGGIIGCICWMVVFGCKGDVVYLFFVVVYFVDIGVCDFGGDDDVVGVLCD